MNILYSNHNRIFNIHTDGIPYLSVDLLDRLGVPNLYSTRYISYDAAEDTGREGLRVVVMKDEDVREAAPVVFDSRDRLAKQLGSSIERECVTDQMHTNRVYTVRPEDLGPILRQDKPERRRSVDGIITDLPDVVLTPENIRFQHAYGTAAAAAELIKQGSIMSARELMPTYLRLPQAERERLAKKDK